jgi:hypothetical protein
VRSTLLGRRRHGCRCADQSFNAFDRDYVNGQTQDQKGNAALFGQEIPNGTDPDLKEFARHPDLAIAAY